MESREQSDSDSNGEDGETPTIALPGNQSGDVDLERKFAQTNLTPSTVTTDQGYANTCTSHALAKCACMLYPDDGWCAQSIADCLNQIFQDTDGTWPEMYNGRSIRVNKQRMPGDLMFTVERCAVGDVKVDDLPDYKFVICYKLDQVSSHTIFVDGCGVEDFKCIDSWGYDDTRRSIAKTLVTQAYRVKATWHEDKFDKFEPTVRDLKYPDKRNIARNLDPNSRWLEFGMRLIDEYGAVIQMKKIEIDNLKLAFRGGGSPAASFLRCLESRKPRYPLKEFRSLAEELEREDIVDATKGLEEKLLLKDISHSHRMTLVNLLDINARGVSSWKDFANKLKFSEIEMDEIGQDVKVPGHSSPSEVLLGRLQQSAPSFKLYYIRKILQDITYVNIANDITEIIQRYRKEKMQE